MASLPKRVAIICDALDFKEKAGIWVYVENLISECILNSEYEFFFVHWKYVPWIPVHSDVIIPASFSDSPIWLILRLFRKFVSMPLKFRRLKIDIVLETNAIAPYSFDKWWTYKKAAMVHDLTPLLFPQYHSFLNRLAFKTFLSRSVQNSDILFVNSEATKNDLVTLYWLPADKVVISRLWLSSFPKKKPLDSLRWSKFILSVATLEPRKNLIRLLESFLLLKRQWKLTGYKLVLTWKYWWKLEDSIKDESLISDFWSDIIRTGYVDPGTLSWLYANCDVFAYTSLYEGFWLPILEAMSHGAPVITSNVSSMPEVAGEAWLLVDPTSINDISSKIQILTTDVKLREKLKTAWIERARLFTWKACAEATFNWFKCLYAK